MNMLTEMAVRMMMVDNKLWDNKRQNIDWNINNFEYLLLKTFELYCVTVWRSGGNACIDVGVESDGCRSVLKGKKTRDKFDSIPVNLHWIRWTSNNR